MTGEVRIRPLERLEDARAAAELIDRIWGQERIVTAELLLAVATHGSLAFGAFEGDRLVGAQMGFVGISSGTTLLHSHVTGIDPAAQHRGLGFAMKKAQRDWCLERGIGIVTWTFDPMIARNAHFNLRKLGAVGVRFDRDYYGPMPDAFNTGERTDRIEVSWDLRSQRVEQAMARQPANPGPAAPSGGLAEPQLLIRVPEDYLSLRRQDPEEAARKRDEVADALADTFDQGMIAVDFERHSYVMRSK